MAELEPMVQIKLIEIAEKMAGASAVAGGSQESFYNDKLKYFDKYYKALAKTVSD